MKRYRTEGSMTVFLSLSLLLILSLLLVLAEGVHYIGLSASVRCAGSSAAESTLAEYNSVLWKQYGILGMDAGYGSSELNIGELENRMNGYLLSANSSDMYSMADAECTASYRFLTDDGCAAFIAQACRKEKSQVAEDLIQKARNVLTGTGEEAEDDIDEVLQKAKDAIKQDQEDAKAAREAEGESSKEDADSSDEAGIAYDEAGANEAAAHMSQNPIDAVIELKEKGLLGMVIPEDMAVSSKRLEDDRVSKRSIATGTLTGEIDTGMVESAVFRLYIMDHFQHFGTDAEESSAAMSYEVEYVICGKDTEKENLKSIVDRLLVAREAENVISLASDPAKMQKASNAAMLFGGATANPFIISAVQAGIVAAWAFIESILDVRLMLSGGKVAFLKTPDQWTSDLYEFPVYLDASVKAKPAESGLSYSNYLLALTAVISDETLAKRCMDLMEASIRTQEGYESCRIDHMVCEVQYEYTVKGAPIFAAPASGGDRYTFGRTERISYL